MKSLPLPARHRSADRVGQGYDKKYQHYKRNSGFVVVKLQQHFYFSPDWCRQGEACALVKQYYVMLRSLLKSRPDLRPYVSRCRHCRIFFLTHPCNAGRKDLGCPFGCREAHRKQRSSERSSAYYTTAEGKVKKKVQNGKRVQGGTRAAAKHPGGLVLVASMVGYLAMVASLIERRRVSKEEILQMLARAMRQHSMARRRRMDYVVAELDKNAP